MSFVYVTLLGSGEVVKYDTITGTIEGRQSLGTNGMPYEVSVSENNVIVYDAWKNTPELIEIEDVDPNQFYFTYNETVERNSIIYTNTITLSGLTNDSIISVPNIFSSVILINGVESGQQGIVANGDNIQIKYSTPIEPNIQIKIPVFIGSTSFVIETKTKEVDDKIDQFIFDDIFLWQNDVSNEITITGLDPDVIVPFNIDRGTIIHNGVESGLSVNVSDGDTISIKAPVQTEKTNFINIECANHIDIIATINAPSILPRPNINIFEDVTGALPDTGNESETVIVSGLGEFQPEPTEFDEEGNPIIPPAIPNTFDVTLEPYVGAYIIKNGQNVGQSTTFIDGDTYSIYGISNNNEYSERTIGIYGDGWVSTFTIINEPDYVPDTIAFEPIIDANVRSPITTKPYTITGLSPEVEIEIETFNSDENLLKFLQPIIFVNEVPYIGEPATVKDGDEIRIEFKFIGAVWDGDSISFELRKTSGFVIGKQDVYSGYLNGISNQMFHPVHRVFNEGDIFEWHNTNKKYLGVEKTFEHKKSSLQKIIESEIIFQVASKRGHSEFNQPMAAAVSRRPVVIEKEAAEYVHKNTSQKIEKDSEFEWNVISNYDAEVSSEFVSFIVRDIKSIDYGVEIFSLSNRIFADFVEYEYEKPYINGESYISMSYIREEDTNQKTFEGTFVVNVSSTLPEISAQYTFFEAVNEYTCNAAYTQFSKDNVYEYGMEYVYHGYNEFNEVGMEYVLHQRSHKEFIVEFISKPTQISKFVDIEFIAKTNSERTFIETEFLSNTAQIEKNIQADFSFNSSQFEKNIQTDFLFKEYTGVYEIDSEYAFGNSSEIILVGTDYFPNVQQELKLIDMVNTKHTLYQREVLNDALPQKPHIPDNNKELGSSDGTAENPDYEFEQEFDFDEVHFDEVDDEGNIISPPTYEYTTANYSLANIPFSTTEISPELQGTNTAVFAGAFERGPVGQPQLITSQEELEKVFGKPTELSYNDWYQCYNFLEHSNSLYVTRALSVRVIKTIQKL